jgi:serine protease Do
VAEPRVTCSDCQASYRLKAEPRPGSRLKCPKCGATIAIRLEAPHRPRDPVGVDPHMAASAAAPRSSSSSSLPWIVAAASLVLVVAMATYLVLRENHRPAPVLADAPPQPVAQPMAPTPLDQDPELPTNPAHSASVEPAQSSPSAKLVQSPAEAAPVEQTADQTSIADQAPVEEEQQQHAGAVPIEAAPAPIAVGGAGLRYEWRSGEIHFYNLEQTIDLGNSTQTTQGTVSLRVSPWRQPGGQTSGAGENGAVEPPDWTGTAFVVHPDGYLATCAHVVDEAQELIVRLNGGSYKAIVVSSDEAHDVALIRINARSLAPLPLADDRRVELGESVRVLGYPYSELLGGSLKVSQGIVSGVVEEGPDRKFQVDASLNPGNSGGPVINERGEVLGVAASVYRDGMAQGLGFASPAATVVAMLGVERLKPVPVAPSEPLTGPALVARAARSVALIEGRYSHTSAISSPIEFSAIAFTSNEAKKGDFQGGASMNYGSHEHIHAFGKMTVDSFGKIVDQEVAPQSTPSGAGLIALVVKEIDPKGRTSWVDEREINFARPASVGSAWDALMPSSGPFGGPFAPSAPYQFGQQPRMEFGSASLRDAYRIAERRANGKIVIERTLSIVAESENAEVADASVDGLGRYVFDPQLGCLESLDFDQTYKFSARNVDVNVPVHIRFTHAAVGDFARQQLVAAQNRAKTNPLPTARGANGAANAEQDVDDLLAAIAQKLGDDDLPIRELQELGDMPVVPARQAKVCKVLLLLAADGGSAGGHSAFRALERWADASCVMPLINLLDDGDEFSRGQVAEILGKLGDPRAAQPIARLIARDRFGGSHYARALESLGPAAETALIPLLKYKDQDVQRTACGVLEKVGSRRSLIALQGLVSDDRDDWLVSHAAERAIEEIRGREAGQAVRDEIGDANEGEPAPGDRTGRTGLDVAIATLSRSDADSSDAFDALSALQETYPPDERTRRKVAGLLMEQLVPDASSFNRGPALRALPNWIGPEHEGDLLKLLASDGRSIRPDIYAALGAVGGKDVGQALLVELEQHSDDQQLAPKIADALARCGESVRDELIARLASQEMLVRAMAARALAGIPGDDVDAALERAIANEKMNVALEEAINATAQRRARR